MQKQSIAVDFNNYDGSTIDIDEMGQVSVVRFIELCPRLQTSKHSFFFCLFTSRNDSTQRKLTLPVYLNSTRAELLFTVDLAVAPGQDPHSFYERGVAVLTSTALN